MRDEQAVFTVGPIIGVVVVVLALIGLLAVCNDSDNNVGTFGRVELAGHDYDGGDQNYEDQWSNEDRNRNRDRNRGAFSPGPFDDSPVDAFNNVCMPGATCHYDGRRGEEPRPQEGGQR